MTDPVASYCARLRARLQNLTSHELVEGTEDWDFAHDYDKRKANAYALRVFDTLFNEVKTLPPFEALADVIEHVVRFKLPPTGVDAYRRWTSAVLVDVYPSKGEWPRRLLVFEAEDPTTKKREFAESPRYENQNPLQVYRRR